MYSNILELIGNTPIVKINTLAPHRANIYAKVEGFNPSGSVKVRICLSMVEDAERKGLINNGTTIIEPTSGNTGIGLAMVCAVKKYKLILTMPESMSIERKKILKSYGAKLILTPAELGMKGAIQKAEQLLTEIDGAFMPQQFKNMANPEIHRKTTAQEIVQDLQDININVFVCGVGSGGTITGVGEVLKDRYPNIKIIAVEPAASSVLSGGKPGSHGIQGIGAGFIPEVLNKDIIDEIVQVNSDDAISMAKELCIKEGLFVGISSGAAMYACVTFANRLNKETNILTIFPDTGERYLSM